MEPTPTGGTHGVARPGFRPLGRLVPFVGVVLFLAALVVLHRELSAHGFAELANGIRSLPPASLLAGLALTLVSFGVLSAYEALAVRYADRALDHARVAFASFVGFAFSQALGSPLLTGAPVRYRLYSAWELSTDEIGRIVAFYTATSWVGVLAVLGGALLALPGGLWVGTPLPAWALRSLGLAALAVLGGYAIWTFVAKEPLRIFSWELPVPSPALAGGQVAAGVADWLVGAGVLYVLLPSGHGLPFPSFVAVFTLALALGQISLVPGGLGVFEAAL
ncbi:MAG TPA: hypothetical protein VLL48_08900, partial [Longimicrobiales bacterium]|nr:hypothetical protein [Longimicrobiales bacterium]